ncbi:PREDICTED: protein TIFY 10B-like isoform X2 [Ipomoea nil]|nr:PREDICTED: protein TIFY 10B-like isoform X2 [Ipomoea nil]XP_019194564.1 PREDICTED: protein TIFY 10B-like isoform X2 [Ipomoea nil]
MGSSEIVDSGRPSGQKSNFSHTCTLLSQYLKEKGSFGDLSLGISRNLEGSGTAAQTMNLLPMIEKSGQNSGPKPGNLFPNFTKEEATKKTDSSVAKAETEKSQMTIFYGGQVLVFNDFPAEKVKEIMVLAKGGNTTHNPNNIFSYNNTPTLVSPKPAESSATNMVTPPAVPKVVPSLGNQKPSQPITSDLPIARRHSLARFLEKRKDR